MTLPNAIATMRAMAKALTDAALACEQVLGTAPAANVKNRLGTCKPAKLASGTDHAGAPTKKETGRAFPARAECLDCGAVYTRTGARSRCPKCYPKVA